MDCHWTTVRPYVKQKCQFITMSETYWGNYIYRAWQFHSTVQLHWRSHRLIAKSRYQPTHKSVGQEISSSAQLHLFDVRTSKAKRQDKCVLSVSSLINLTNWFIRIYRCIILIKTCIVIGRHRSTTWFSNRQLPSLTKPHAFNFSTSKYD